MPLASHSSVSVSLISVIRSASELYAGSMRNVVQTLLICSSPLLIMPSYYRLEGYRLEVGLEELGELLISVFERLSLVATLELFRQ